jgi:hypothetical protein
MTPRGAAGGRRDGEGHCAPHALRLLGAACCALLFALAPAAAQQPGGERTFYSRYREFRIPFDVDPAERRIQSVRLHASDNQGLSWQAVATAQPGGEKGFNYRAEHDGWYWFTVQTVDHDRRAYPPVIDQNAPVGLKVCVDTREPAVTLQAASAGESGVGVSWVIQDPNLNNLLAKPDTLILEYRPAGSGGPWTRQQAEPRAAGQRVWSPATAGPQEVRLRVFDDAGNEGQAAITVTPGRGGSLPPEGDGTPPRRPNADGRRLVRSKRINLNYDVQEVGKSGVSVVELWYTDGKSWQLRNQKRDPQPPYVYDIELEAEGLYGFSLVARSGVGLGEQPPRVGDPPQIWIEADWTKPRVSLHRVEVGQGIDTGSLFVTWSAEDLNLDRDGSITLSYAERPDGPWTAFAPNQNNTGRYVWRMPPAVPFQFYVRVEATDRAGNVGNADSGEPVKVDLNRPKARVTTIEPVQK